MVFLRIVILETEVNYFNIFVYSLMFLINYMLSLFLRFKTTSIMFMLEQDKLLREYLFCSRENLED